MAITATALKTQYGAFYLDGGQSEKNLFDQVFRTATFDNLFTMVKTNDTIIRNVLVSGAEVLQGYQSAFTAKGGVTFDPAPIDLYHVKADDKILPDTLEDSYVGFLTGEGQKRADWPVVRYWLERIFFQQLVEDIQTNAFKAEAVTPTAGTATTALQALNGFKKIVQLRIADGKIPSSNIISTGALEADPVDFVEQVEAMVGGIPDHLVDRLNAPIVMAPVLAARFKTGMRTKYNMNYQQADLVSVVNHENLKVVGDSALSGSSKIFIAEKKNLVLGIKRPALLADIQPADREVKALHDHWRGYGIVDGRYFWTNDLENS